MIRAYASVVDTVLLTTLWYLLAFMSALKTRLNKDLSYGDANLHLEPLLHGRHPLEVGDACLDVLVDGLLYMPLCERCSDRGLCGGGHGSQVEGA